MICRRHSSATVVLANLTKPGQHMVHITVAIDGTCTAEDIGPLRLLWAANSFNRPVLYAVHFLSFATIQHVLSRACNLREQRNPVFPEPELGCCIARVRSCYIFSTEILFLQARFSNCHPSFSVSVYPFLYPQLVRSFSVINSGTTVFPCLKLVTITEFCGG